MTSGSCLCGNVAYEFSAEVRGVIHCHCTTCRKAHGSAFSSVARVPAAKFRITGDKHLNSFESSSGKHRYFCSNCGTHIYAKRDGRDHVILRLGSLDTQLRAKEVAHTWMSHSADWFDLDGYLPRYAQDTPDFSQAPDVAHDFSTNMGRLVTLRFLPVAILIGMPYVGFALVSGAVVENPLFIAALFLLAVGLADVCWYFFWHPIRVRLTPSALVASGLFFDKEYPLSCLVGFYSHPYTKAGYFEISYYKCSSTVESMRLFDGPGRDLFKHALLERAPWVKDFGV